MTDSYKEHIEYTKSFYNCLEMLSFINRWKRMENIKKLSSMNCKTYLVAEGRKKTSNVFERPIVFIPPQHVISL